MEKKSEKGFKRTPVFIEFLSYIKVLKQHEIIE